MIDLKIYINDRLVDLTGEDEIAQTYAVNSFGDISSRNSSYSNTFHLPFTSNNKSILENSEIVVNSTNVPYTRLPCKVIIGVMVVNGFAELTKCKDYYEVRIYGGNFDFYSLIKSKFISELYLSAYDHEWNITNIVNSRTNTSGYIYGLIDYHSDSPSSYFPESSRTVDVRTLYPGMFLHTIIDKIISEAGYTKSGNIFSLPEYLNKILPFSKDKFEREDSDDNEFKAIKTSDQTIESTFAPGIHLQDFQNDSTDGGFDNGGNYDGTNKYTLPVNAYMRLVASVTIQTTSGGIVIGELFVNGGVFPSNRTLFNVVQGSNSTVTYILDSGFRSWSSGDYFQVGVAHNLIGTAPVVKADSFFYNEIAPKIEWNTDITMNTTLAKIKQGDLLKSILNKFGCIIQVDNENKIVYANQFSEIIDNIPNAEDWSDKLDESEKTDLTFKLDNYAQINNFTYKEDDSVIKPDGTDYELLIPNENLESETDLVESVFAASEQVIRLEGLDTNIIKLLTAGALDQKVEPRILTLRTIDITDGNGDIDYHDPINSITSSQNTSIPLTHFILAGQEFNLGWEDNLAPTYLSEIEETLQRVKIIKELIKLTPADINQLDFFRPVWLDKHKAYFYISEISQYKFTSRESTIVELVKLP